MYDAGTFDGAHAPMSAPTIRAAGAFLLILEFEAAFFGTGTGRYCTTSFSWYSAALGLLVLFVPGFIFTVLVPLAASILATRAYPWPDVDDPDVRFWFVVTAIALPILVAFFVLLVVPADPACAARF